MAFLGHQKLAPGSELALQFQTVAAEKQALRPYYHCLDPRVTGRRHVLRYFGCSLSDSFSPLLCVTGFIVNLTDDSEVHKSDEFSCQKVALFKISILH